MEIVIRYFQKSRNTFLLKIFTIRPNHLLTSLKADLHRVINGGFTFSWCLNGKFPWRRCSAKALVS